MQMENEKVGCSYTNNCIKYAGDHLTSDEESEDEYFSL